MVRYLTDSRIEAVLDDMYGYAAAGDYYQAAGAFVEDLEVCYDNGIAADQYNYDSETGKISQMCIRDSGSMDLMDLAFLMVCFLVTAVFCGGIGIFSSSLMRRSTFSNVCTLSLIHI